MNLTKYVEDLESRIDPTDEAQLHAAWRESLDNGDLRAAPGLTHSLTFVPPKRKPTPPGIEWPEVHINDALTDMDAMILQQLCGVSAALESGSNAVLNVRSNYGVSIMTSQLGCEVVLMPREHHNLPTTRPLTGIDAIRDVVQQGVPDLRTGQGADVFDCGTRYLELFRGFPKVSEWVLIYHPDAQGPIDNAELAWGSPIFLAFYDTPDLVHQFLDVMTDHYVAFLKAWFAEHPPRDEISSHWGYMLKGQVMLRDDSLMNLSPEIYDEFIFDREARCFDELGGGAIHFCGRGSHVIDRFSRMRSLTGVNSSQPHLNDMGALLKGTVDQGLSLLALPHAALPGGSRDLRGLVHCQ